MNIENKDEVITEIRMNKKDREAFFDEYLRLEDFNKTHRPHTTNERPTREKYPTIYEIFQFINSKGCNL